MNKRILFVDDEPAILAGLRLMLRKERHRWDMAFAESGHSALELLRAAPFDVVVSDMRMPGMDGAALLERTKEEFPTAVRVILSGHAEREAVVRAVPVCHQFLSKPCDREAILGVVERACAFQDLLAKPEVRRVVGSLEKLPSAPQAYWDLTRAMARPGVTTDAIARIVERDPAMSAKLLQLVSTSFFGNIPQITSIERAVACLGVELVRSLVLTAHIFGAATPEEEPAVLAVQDHSILTALVARQLLPPGPQAEEAFTAALLHDVGKIILAQSMPEEMARIAAKRAKDGLPLHVEEHSALGVTHAGVGAYLLGVWGLPLPIVEAVAYHHSPRIQGYRAFDAVGAVHVADALVTGEPNALDAAYIESLHLEEKVASWREAVENEKHRIAS